MKKIPFYLLLIYMFSLATALFGYWIDADEPVNSFAYQMFEVFMLSLIIYVLLLLFFFIPYFLFQFFKRIIKSKH
ncbi:hypothetical protein [Flavobacterium sp.]|uniref:hypothetical protein n=1 Tax=Flavobacterium sp. TaxID=239 RepID=UPI00391D00E5